MTKYSVTRYEGEAQPCAIADPNGCFYSTGEVDREIARLSAENSRQKQEIADLFQSMNDVEPPIVREMRILINDMVAWFKWYQPYPSRCVQEFIERARKFEGGNTDDERAAATVPGGHPWPSTGDVPDYGQNQRNEVPGYADNYGNI